MANPPVTPPVKPDPQLAILATLEQIRNLLLIAAIGTQHDIEDRLAKAETFSDDPRAKRLSASLQRIMLLIIGAGGA